MEDAFERSGSYWFYGAISAAGVVFVLLLVPETKGKTPEEMKRHFS